MHIGLDFDNTIANYEGVFYRVALDKGLIPGDLAKTKNAVRDFLNGTGRAREFTELQGYVYGARMDLVTVYDGVGEFVAAAVASSHSVSIISHKTRRPIAGPAYDMHASAVSFLEATGILGSGMISADQVFFETTKEAKVARIAGCGIDVFVDDLPEILTMEGLPRMVRRILFDPLSLEADLRDDIECFGDWRAIQLAVLR